MKATSVIVVLGCLLAACATKPDQAASQASPDSPPIAAAPADAASTLKTTSDEVLSALQDTLPADANVAVQRMPNDSIQLRLAGDNVFAFGSVSVRPEQAGALEPVTAVLQHYPQCRVEIVGYTDNVGSPQFNKALSEKRAVSVAHILVAQGVPASRIQIRGAGADDPVADNHTAAGRSRNRRVEIFISTPAPLPIADRSN